MSAAAQLEIIAWFHVLAKEMEKKWKHSRAVEEVVGLQELVVHWILGVRESEMLRKTAGFVTCVPGQKVMSFKDWCNGGRSGLGRKLLS